MSDELKEAVRLFDELLGHDVLGHWEVVLMPSKNSKARLYGNRPTVELAIGTPPVAIADEKGVRILNRKRWRDAWDYAYEHGLEPPLWVWERACASAKELGIEPPKRNQV